MKMWPWSEISNLKDYNDKLNRELKVSEARLAANKSLIKRAHFRNPETGRIGRKGQIFDV
jgi:hypothetical protein